MHVRGEREEDDLPEGGIQLPGAEGSADQPEKAECPLHRCGAERDAPHQTHQTPCLWEGDQSRVLQEGSTLLGEGVTGQAGEMDHRLWILHDEIPEARWLEKFLHI
eukprot:gene21680-biopygen7518